jgi:hypothetical protein
MRPEEFVGSSETSGKVEPKQILRSGQKCFGSDDSAINFGSRVSPFDVARIRFVVKMTFG